MHAEISNYKVATYSRNPTHSHIATIGLQDTSNTYVGYIFFTLKAIRCLPPIHREIHGRFITSMKWVSFWICSGMSRLFI
jgi:hypothetical protein